MNTAYQRLDPRIQKWIIKQGWSDLREIQKKSIPPILAGNQDVLISASTAAGKTEAFFLPACSAITDRTDGFGILSISPLKALINDQNRRLESLCDILDMQLTPWHGESSQSKKKAARKTPSGILLITPESLESLLVRDAGWVKKAFRELQYIVIDEFHAFIGRERGQQLTSLLNRLEYLLDRIQNPIPRTALSATLGDLEDVPRSLRPNGSLPCATISSTQTSDRLRLAIKGYVGPLTEEEQPSSLELVCEELYRVCRGSSHLVYANSRNRAESLTVRLSDLCLKRSVPNEFFPHHGSLSKESRELLEARLQKEALPTTAVCTMTLELGIDIGKVQSVVQVTAPHSVSSLRQRLGRSGRRGEPAILRMLISENELHQNSSLNDKLRMELLQSIAMLRLLVDGKWFEPADTSQYHFSTLLHQSLAVTGQWGSVRADQLYEILCKTGPFQEVSTKQFKELLTQMGQNELLTQLSSGELILGIKGEEVVSRYSFYAVFNTPQEFRIINEGKTLGALPVDSMVLVNQHIVFGGKRWKIYEIDTAKKVILVQRAKGGRPPKFGGSGMSIHDVVRQQMFWIYREGDYRISNGADSTDFLDDTARQLFTEGLSFFREAGLETRSLMPDGVNTYVLPWRGDRVINTLVALLMHKEFQASAFAGIIEIENADLSQVRNALLSLLNEKPPKPAELASLVPEKELEKYDKYLPEPLLNDDYGRRAFDINGAMDWIRSFSKERDLDSPEI